MPRHSRCQERGLLGHAAAVRFEHPSQQTALRSRSMETLCLQPAMQLPRHGEYSEPLCLSAELCAQAQRDVWLMEDGNLAAAPAGQTPIGEEDRLLFSL